MRIILQDSNNFQEQLKPLLNRSAFDPQIDKSVAQILADVKNNGDDALVEYAKRFDHVDLTP